MTKRSTPSRTIDEMVSAFQESHVIFAALRLGIFEQLNQTNMTSIDLANSIGADSRGVRIICDALCSLSVLDKTDDRYTNSAEAQQLLINDSPDSQTAMILHRANLAERWSKLYDIITTGKPIEDETLDPRFKKDEASFAKAMADVARQSAGDTAKLIDLTHAKRMLDIGGGPGLYSIEFAKRNPHLHVTLFDTDATLDVARQNIHQAGLENRITTQTGDALKDPFGSGYNFILLSNFVHIFSEEVNKELVAKCAKALTPGGCLCIKDFILEADRTTPQWSALFAVNMLVNTESGDCYTLDQVRTWFSAAELRFEKMIDQTPQSRLVLGKK